MVPPPLWLNSAHQYDYWTANIMITRKAWSNNKERHEFCYKRSPKTYPGTRLKMSSKTQVRASTIITISLNSAPVFFASFWQPALWPDITTVVEVCIHNLRGLFVFLRIRNSTPWFRVDDPLQVLVLAAISCHVSCPISFRQRWNYYSAFVLHLIFVHSSSTWRYSTADTCLHRELRSNIALSAVCSLQDPVA